MWLFVVVVMHMWFELMWLFAVVVIHMWFELMWLWLWRCG